MDILMLICINLIAVFFIYATHRRVWGLRGGYGKGVWGGYYMHEALEERLWAWIVAAIILILDVAIWVS